MEKRTILMLTGLVCCGVQSTVQAYPRATMPWSPCGVATVGSAVGLTAGLLTKLVTSNPPADVTVGVGGNVFWTMLRTRLSPLSDTWSSVAASVVGLVTAGIVWKCLSSYTARGYANAAQAIMSGEKCTQPAVLDFVQRCAGNAQVLSDAVVNHFAAQKNELVKAVSALEQLDDQLSLAYYYLDVAQRDCTETDSDLLRGLQEIIEQHLEVIKSASLLIKAQPDFARQSTIALQELNVYAQFATANAIRDAGNASRVHYAYNLN